MSSATQNIYFCPTISCSPFAIKTWTLLSLISSIAFATLAFLASYNSLPHVCVYACPPLSITFMLFTLYLYCHRQKNAPVSLNSFPLVAFDKNQLKTQKITLDTIQLFKGYPYDNRERFSENQLSNINLGSLPIDLFHSGSDSFHYENEVWAAGWLAVQTILSSQGLTYTCESLYLRYSQSHDLSQKSPCSLDDATRLFEDLHFNTIKPMSGLTFAVYKKIFSDYLSTERFACPILVFQAPYTFLIIAMRTLSDESTTFLIVDPSKSLEHFYYLHFGKDGKRLSCSYRSKKNECAASLTFEKGWRTLLICKKISP